MKAFWHQMLTELRLYTRSVGSLAWSFIFPIFVIFSDDIPWAKKHLSFGDRAIFVDWNDAGANYADLKLQSACRHNIIANSSFSWWGAWLGRNQDKVVIAPRDWFSHGQSCFHKGHSIVPARWVRL